MSNQQRENIANGHPLTPINPIDLLFRPQIVAALANLGNTCFANSSLQSLANVPTIVGALRYVCRFGISNTNSNGNNNSSSTPGILPPSQNNSRTSNVVRCTAQTLDRMESGEELVVRPIELIRSVQEVNETFASGIGEQHDAAEWMLHGVLDACDDYRVDRSISAKHLSEALHDLKGVSNGQLSPKLGARLNPGRFLASQGKFAVWKAMAQVDDENAKDEWEDKKKRNGGIPVAGDFASWKKNSYYSPSVIRSAALDCMRGTFLQETKCNSCGNSSRIFNPLTSFELSFPSAAERVAYREIVQERRYQSSNQTAAESTQSVLAAAAALQQRKKEAGDPSSEHHQDGDDDDHNNSSKDCGISPASSFIWKILFLPCALFTSLARAVARLCQSLFGSPPEEPVTIDELLWAYCRSRGSKFRCSACGKTESPCSITIRILDLPQVLAIHLKRFEQSSFGGLWTEKIPDFVEFPGAFDATEGSDNNNGAVNENNINHHLIHHHVLSLDQGSPLSTVKSGKGLVLDLEPFTVKVRETTGNNKASAESNDNEEQQQFLTFSSATLVTDTDNASSQDAQTFHSTNSVTTYNLNSVINHHGGINGGHYTAFCRKPPAQFQEEKSRWALFNDSRASETSQEVVLQSQAYILMYERETLCKEGDDLTKLRMIAKEYLLGVRRINNINNMRNVVKVSRMWLFRVATFAEPGPLLHRVGEFENNNNNNNAVVPASVYANVSEGDFNLLVDTFGELLLPPL